jgi:hypothetical protein
MPISEYFGGEGRGVMQSMKKQYGPEKGAQVFYATANKQGQKPGRDSAVKPVAVDSYHPNTLSSKEEQLQPGTKVHNSRGATGTVVKLAGSSVVVDVNGRQEEWDMRRVFRAADAEVKPVPVDAEDTTYATKPPAPRPLTSVALKSPKEAEEAFRPRTKEELKASFGKDAKTEGTVTFACPVCGERFTNKITGRWDDTLVPFHERKDNRHRICQSGINSEGKVISRTSGSAKDSYRGGAVLPVTVKDSETLKTGWAVFTGKTGSRAGAASALVQSEREANRIKQDRERQYPGVKLYVRRATEHFGEVEAL